MVWFVKEGLKVKQKMSKYQVVSEICAGRKEINFQLGIREAVKSKPQRCVEFIKREARRSGDIPTKVRQRLGKVRCLE